MSDMSDTQTEFVDEVVDAPPEPETETPPPPEPQPEWAQRFPNGADDIWKSFREAERAKTQAEQRAADLERQYSEAQQQEYYDPWSEMGPYLDETQLQQLSAKAEADPAKWAKWAYENHDQVGPEVAGHLFQYWQSRDYWAAENWKANVQFSQYYAQMRQEIEGEFAPVRQHTTQQMSQITLDYAQRIIPDWEMWAPRIAEYLEQPENAATRQAIDVAGLGSEAAAERLFDIYGVLWARQNRQTAQTQPQAPPPPPTAQTETNSTSPGRDEQGRFASNTTTPATQSGGRRTGRLDHL